MCWLTFRIQYLNLHFFFVRVGSWNNYILRDLVYIVNNHYPVNIAWWNYQISFKYYLHKYYARSWLAVNMLTSWIDLHEQIRFNASICSAESHANVHQGRSLLVVPVPVYAWRIFIICLAQYTLDITHVVKFWFYMCILTQRNVIIFNHNGLGGWLA